MAFEIDFLGVGTESKCADSIVFRFGDLEYGSQFVCVVDAGYESDGQKVIDHLAKYYDTDIVDLLISTHPDVDHSGGLPVIVNNLQVNELWMHQPWDHSTDILGMFKDGRMTETSLSDHLKKGLQDVHDMLELSIEKEITVSEPFSDGLLDVPNIQVLGPSREYYQSLLPSFRKTPEATLQSALRGLVKAVIQLFRDAWDAEALEDPPNDATSAENNSATILLVDTGEGQILLTSDCGVPALTNALERAASLGITLSNCKIVQIPHHGSRRNVGPTLLNELIGPIVDEGSPSDKYAVASTAPNSGPKHPSMRVINGFIRRGRKSYSLKGNTLHWATSDAPTRVGWSASTPVPFSTEFEE